MVPVVPFCRSVIDRAQSRSAIAVVLGSVLAVAVTLTAAPGPRADQAAARSDGGELFARVWAGVEHAGRVVKNACGALTETRVSSLFARPLVFRGTFCAAGMTAFRLDYAEPEPLRVIYNDGILNVTIEGGHRTEVLDIGRAVLRTQDYFAGPHALQNVRRDFSVAATEDANGYTVTLTPLSKRFSARVREVVARLGRNDFLLRRLEISGKSGVDSLFDVKVERKNVPLDAQTFRVHRPRAGGTTAGPDGH
jgi:hypothetical protein